MLEKSVQLMVPGDVMPYVGDLNHQPRSVLRNRHTSMLLGRALQPHKFRKNCEGLGSGVVVARRKQEQQGGSLSYEAERGMVVWVQLAEMLIPRTTGDASNI